METSVSGLLGLLPAYLRLLEVFRGAPLLVFELPENISARRRRVLEYSLLYKGLFACLSMNDNKYAEDFKVPLLVVKKNSHLTTSSRLLQPSTPSMNFVIF